MVIFINVLMIITALIILMGLYFIYIRREKAVDNKPQMEETDFEAGEELGVDSSELNVKEEYVEGGEQALAGRYNKTLIRLLSRDPNWLFTYWEITEPEYYQYPPCLRVFSELEDSYQDITINHETDNWYIPRVKANNKYRVAIGYKKEGIFHPLCYSNTVKTPARGPSDIIDEKWMTIEELSSYTYRIEINSTLSLIKSLQKRREREEVNIDSFTFTRNND